MGPFSFNKLPITNYFHENNWLEMAFYHLKEGESICHFWQMDSLSLIDKTHVVPMSYICLLSKYDNNKSPFR